VESLTVVKWSYKLNKYQCIVLSGTTGVQIPIILFYIVLPSTEFDPRPLIHYSINTLCHSVIFNKLNTMPNNLSHSDTFSGVLVTRSLVLCVCFVDRCLSFCVFFFWPLCCLFFFDIRILITPLVSSNSSYKIIHAMYINKT